MIAPSTRKCGGQHQRNVFARSGFGLVGIDHEVARLGRLLVDERPFGAGWETCPTPAAQPGFLDFGYDVLRRHTQCPAKSEVAVVVQIGLHRPRLRCIPEPAQYRRQRGGRAVTEPPEFAGNLQADQGGLSRSAVVELVGADAGQVRAVSRNGHRVVPGLA